VFRRLLILLVLFLVIVVVAADRVGAIVAAQVLSSKIKTDEGLAHRPDVTVAGFPFLTQALRGKYSDVRVTASDVVLNRLDVTTVAVQLHGVHIGWKAALHGNVHQVPVDRADGQVTISYAAVDAYLRSRHLTVSEGSGGQVKVTGSVTIAGHTIKASGLGTATISHNVVDVHVHQISAAAGSHVAHLSVAQRINFSLPLSGLPFRIALGSVHATAAGIVATGTAPDIVLGGHG
jgi:uncharacterized MnhB-related membrane protein